MKDKNKIITFITIIALLFIGLFFFGKPSQNGSKAIQTKNIPEGAEELANSHTAGLKNSLTASETYYDFGTISMKNGNVSKVFEIKNPSDQDIKVPKIFTSCMCTNAYILNPDGTKKGPFGMPGHGGAVSPANAVVKPGEMLLVEVVYDPNAHGPAGVGRIERAVYVEDENRNVIELKFKVNVTP